MSDTSQGPGWWQASDGKWYAPELHPDRPATTTASPTASPTEGPDRGRRPAKWVALAVVVAVVAAGTFLVLREKGSGTSSTAKFCDMARALKDDTSLDNAFSDPSRIDIAVGKFDALVSAAPSEIKADLQTVAQALHTVAAAVKSAGNDPEKQFSQLFGTLLTLDQQKYQAAGNHVDAFTQDRCGFTLNSSGSDGSVNLSDLSDLSDLSNFSGFSDFLSAFSS